MSPRAAVLPLLPLAALVGVAPALQAWRQTKVSKQPERQPARDP